MRRSPPIGSHVRIGVALTPIVARQPIRLEDLRGRRVAIDGNGELYQFLALYLEPDVTREYDLTFHACDADGVRRLLCDEHAFSRDRVDAALERAFGGR